MRSCDEIVELISASLDGELSVEEQAALNEHIACCPACSALLDDLRALHTAAADWEEVPAPAGFAEAVMSAVAAEAAREKPDNVIPFTPKTAKPTHWKKWGVTAAAVAIVVLGAVSVPSLMGNFSHKNAASESADMAYSLNDAVAEAVMDQAEPQASAYVQIETEEMDTNTVEKGTATDKSPAELPLSEEYGYSATTKPYDPMTDVSAPSSVPETDRYVGELILDGMLDRLSGEEGAACSDGTVTYLVSADVFAEVLELLEDEKPVGYSYTAGNADASLGKIIVQSN